jgi:hypothetical protein
MIRELTQIWPANPHAALDLAVVYSGLQRKDQALHWLEVADKNEVGDLITIGRNPHFASLRTDPRFQNLAKQLGAPQ